MSFEVDSSANKIKNLKLTNTSRMRFETDPDVIDVLEGVAYDYALFDTGESRTFILRVSKFDLSSGKCPSAHINVSFAGNALGHIQFMSVNTSTTDNKEYDYTLKKLVNIETSFPLTQLNSPGQNISKAVCKIDYLNFLVDNAAAYNKTGKLVDMKRSGILSFYDDNTFSLKVDDYLEKPAYRMVSFITVSADRVYEVVIDDIVRDKISDAVSRNNCYSLPKLNAFFYEYDAGRIFPTRRYVIVEDSDMQNAMNRYVHCSLVDLNTGLCNSSFKVNICSTINCYHYDTTKGEYISGNVNIINPITSIEPGDQTSNGDIFDMYVDLIPPLNNVFTSDKGVELRNGILEYSLLSHGVSFKIKDMLDSTALENDKNPVCKEKYLKKYPDGCLRLAVKQFDEYCNASENVNTADCQRYFEFRNKYLSAYNTLSIDEAASFNCGSFSNDFIDKLQFFLNILKIAGPIVAIGLGIVDFGKAVISDDADKEMKNASKKFITRIIAAVLLFLVPFLLAFILDVTIGNKDGYDSDNPFCNVVDWEKE